MSQKKKKTFHFHSIKKSISRNKIRNACIIFMQNHKFVIGCPRKLIKVDSVCITFLQVALLIWAQTGHALSCNLTQDLLIIFSTHHSLFWHYIHAYSMINESLRSVFSIALSVYTGRPIYSLHICRYSVSNRGVDFTRCTIQYISLSPLNFWRK